MTVKITSFICCEINLNIYMLSFHAKIIRLKDSVMVDNLKQDGGLNLCFPYLKPRSHCNNYLRLSAVDRIA